ncbi:MAG: CopG family antitoxin [Caldilineaceae bacterium]
MEKIKPPKVKIPQTDSIEELAEFWDTHDLTDFEDELEEVNEPVFVREQAGTIQISLPEKELDAIVRIANDQHKSYEALLREWILEKLYYSEAVRRMSEEFQAS